MVHLDQISACEIDIGQRAYKYECDRAQQELAQAIIETENLLRIEPDREKYPFVTRGEEKLR